MHEASVNDHPKGLCNVDLQQWSPVSMHVHYRPMSDHLQVLRSMDASICKGVCL